MTRVWGVDLIGRRFGRLEVVSKNAKRDKQSKVVWRCLCDCGKVSNVSTTHLVYRGVSSCGKCNAITIGQRFNRLTIVSKSRVRAGQNKTMWNCLCDCGNKVRAIEANIKNGNTTSCGCYKYEASSKAKIKHMVDKYGGYISSKDPWYIRAGSVWKRITKDGVKSDFRSLADAAIYLKSIAPKVCPVLGESMTNGDGVAHKYSPSVDRIIPSKGYTKDNIQIISYKANTMKQDATPKQLVKFSVWALKSVLGNEVKILWKGKEL